MTGSDIVVNCKEVSKSFRWYDRSLSLKESFTRIFNRNKKEWQWYILKDLSLQVRNGERVAVIGKNGSGKSTLLKLISGIYSPTNGSIEVNSGRRLSLIELGAGFYPDLTGRENIRLNWVFNGLPRKELDSKLESIVEFSGISKFLDTPVKYYSSGMKARLGFSIAVHADPDLLIIDEILAVGDEEFHQKCYDEIDKLCIKGITLIFVSHSLEDVERVCTRAVWLENGNIKMDGNVGEVLSSYRNSFDFPVNDEGRAYDLNRKVGNELSGQSY